MPADGSRFQHFFRVLSAHFQDTPWRQRYTKPNQAFGHASGADARRGWIHKINIRRQPFAGCDTRKNGGGEDRT
jgi:hypothetical protein